MQHILSDYTGEHHPFAYNYDCFTSQELDILQEQARRAEEPSWVGGSDKGVIDDSIRRSNLKWVNNTNETLWVFERLSHYVSDFNSKFFGFDLTGFGEALQLTNYSYTDNGMYDWHADFGGRYSRKLSIVVQLSDPSQYEGGMLQLNIGGKEVVQIEKRRGMIVAFPSWTLHQVTPVTQGSRQSLVAWITGPRFK